MKDGNWIPLSKRLAKYLPKDRPYTKLEAVFSLQLDYDANNPVTVAGYSALWRWSRNRVDTFLQKIGVKLISQVEGKRLKNQKRHISIHIKDIYNEKNRHIRLIDNRELQGKKGISPKKKRHKKDIHPYTTRDTRILNTNSCTLESKKESNLKDCPYNKILDLYHILLAELPRVRKFTEHRRAMLAVRWNEKAKSERGFYSNTLEFWEAFFKYIRESDWLMGRKADWRANFEWIVTKKNFNKIIEGTYHGR